MRASHLHDTLRRFCLGAFAVFTRELEDGADLPFAFEEHGSYGRPTLYEYRPLVRGFVEARTERLFTRLDVQDAVTDLLREPAARIFAHAHEGEVRDERRAVYRSILVPLLVRTAEGCGGFDWDDSAYWRAYEEVEGSLFGEGHSYGSAGAPGRADPARPVSCVGCERRSHSAGRGGRRRAARRCPRPLGARALPVRAVPRRAASPRARSGARRGRRGVGRGDARCGSARCDSARARRSRPAVARADVRAAAPAARRRP